MEYKELRAVFNMVDEAITNQDEKSKLVELLDCYFGPNKKLGNQDQINLANKAFFGESNAWVSLDDIFKEAEMLCDKSTKTKVGRRFSQLGLINKKKTAQGRIIKVNIYYATQLARLIASE